MTKSEIIEEIKKQEQINKKLYYSIPIASKEDPLNKKAEPILKKWRQGQKTIQKLLAELNSYRDTEFKQTQSKIVINGYGEATKRNITCTTYENQQRRLSEEILNFVGR